MVKTTLVDDCEFPKLQKVTTAQADLGLVTGDILYMKDETEGVLIKKQVTSSGADITTKFTELVDSGNWLDDCDSAVVLENVYIS